MNEMDLLKRVLDTPPPPPDRLAAGRARLLAATSGTRAASGTRRRWRVVVPAGLAAATAAAVAVLLAVTLTGGPAVPSGTATASGSPASGSPASANVAAKLLAVAAAAVASEPATEPGPDQWIYQRTVTTQTGAPTQYDDEWITFNGVMTAYHGPDGQLIVHTGYTPASSSGNPLAAVDANLTPLTAYNALAALPADPRALLAAVDAELARTGETMFGITGQATTQPQREFAWLGVLLWNATEAAPPSALAAVYRAVAIIPGVTVDQQATDAAGRPAIGITGNQGQTEILLSPHTYQPVGIIVRTPAIAIAKPSPGYSLSSQGALASPVPEVTHTVGPQTQSIAILTTAEVSGPGRR